ncbi:hypothetical protein CK203_108904 [Vitis vinifera]|uniref:Reverse transcriptase Ty1/copia-type domain-containing protein n=1 Tax=Vitis vinifera TaxID=29760 RepID=A0A438DGV5_VITVI|nr:hypothetical protein CK203_108904 [Vitis vinifera]
MGLVCYTFQLEPKNVKEALGNESWTTAFQEELNQFTRNDVWYLVPWPKDKNVIAPKGFEDPKFPNHVYRLKKALYGLKQALKAWSNDELLVAQIYIDDIVYGVTSGDLAHSFAKEMKLDLR